MSATTAHLVALALGLVWLAFTVLVHRRTPGGWLIILGLYLVGIALVLAGVGVLPIPAVLLSSS